MNKPFIPKDFKIPEKLETDKFRLRMLTVNDVVKDYDAVMSSIKHLQKQKVFGKMDSWPSSDLTLEQDLIDLGWHQKEFQNRTSFAYTVMSPDERKCLGCVYVFPSRDSKYDAQIYMWVREDEFGKGLDSVLFNTVKHWLKKEWPFEKFAFPERE